jgi:hypothetical protein
MGQLLSKAMNAIDLSVAVYCKLICCVNSWRGPHWPKLKSKKKTSIMVDIMIEADEAGGRLRIVMS